MLCSTPIIDEVTCCTGSSAVQTCSILVLPAGPLAITLDSLQLISQGAASSGLSELIVAVGRSQDPYQLSEKVVPHLEAIFKVPIALDKSKCGRVSHLWVWLSMCLMC